jgi:hypothetical protein
MSKLGNPRRRRSARFRKFVLEVLRILEGLDGTAYSVSIDKRTITHEMRLSTTMPLQLQVLVDHFIEECQAESGTGMIVSDWSTKGLDSHANKCISSYVASRRLDHHPGVYYTDSASSHGNSSGRSDCRDSATGSRRRRRYAEAR